MPRALWLADVVADAFRGVKGFRVETYAGWNRRGSLTFDPEGVMDHHTGRGGYDALLRYMLENAQYAPLCNLATSRPVNGVVRVTVCCAGRANHAGRGELPWRRGQGSTGNRRTFGVEHQNDGGQPWPGQQVEAMRRIDAALLTHMGRGVDRMLDHKTYTPRKVDRHTISVAAERVAVQALMDGTEGEQMLKRGDKGNAVRVIQNALIAWEPKALPRFGADGDFGAEMESWVKRYQGAAQIQQTGTVDGVTAALLARYVTVK